MLTSKRAFAGLSTALLTLTLLWGIALPLAFGSPAFQIDPTQQQTVDALVHEYYMHTAVAEQNPVVVEAAQTAFEQSMTATASEESMTWSMLLSSHGYTVKYPSVWIAGDYGPGILLANTQAIYDEMTANDEGPHLFEGEALLVILATELGTGGLPTDLDLNTAFEMLSASSTLTSDPETITLDGVDAIKAYIQGHSSGEGMIVVMLKDNMVITGISRIAAGKIDVYEPIVLSIIASIHFYPLAQ